MKLEMNTFERKLEELESGQSKTTKGFSGLEKGY